MNPNNKLEFSKFMREQTQYFAENTPDIKSLSPETIKEMSCSFRKEYEIRENKNNKTTETGTN